MNSCSVFLSQGRFTWRHDSILVNMLKQLKNAICTNSNSIHFFFDMPGCTTTGGTFPVNIIFSKLRPYIVIVNTKRKSVHLVKLTVPFEHNISKAHERKTHKYADMVFDISQTGYNCNLTCIEIGSRGLVTPETNKSISEIFSSIKAKPPKSLKKYLSKIAILSSYTIWYARHEPSWGPQTNLTSNCNYTVIALICMLFAAFIFLLLCFCLLSRPAPYYGYLYWWPWYMTWTFVYNLFACLIFAVIIYFANKDWLNNTVSEYRRLFNCK